MSYTHFKLAIQSHIAQVAFNRPQKANALHLAAWQEMQAIFEELDQNDEVRVILLRGEGQHFCAGIDLELLMDLQKYQQIACDGRKREQLQDFILALQDNVTAIERCRKPVIAVIDGACIGGGLDIAAACDMRFGTQDAYFSIKEIDLGLVADLGTLQRLPRLIGAGRTAEMAYTARRINGTEAEHIGLLNQVFADRAALEASVGELATTIAAKSPLVVRGIKQALLYARDHSIADSLQQVSLWNAATLLSADLQEAFQAAREQRPAAYKDS